MFHLRFLRSAGWLLVCTLAGSVSLVGCAGGGLNRVDDATELPSDVPKGLAEKFEVREASGAPEPTPSVAPVAEAVPLAKPGKLVGRKKGKGKADPAASPSPSASAAGPIVYPNRRPTKEAIWIGEQQVFELTYFGMPAGDFTLDVPGFKMIGNRKVYHVKGTAISSKVFSMFYRVNDVVETFIDYEGIFSHKFHLVLDESLQTRDSLELYDSEKRQTFYWNRWNHKKKGYIENKEFAEIPQFPQDSVSALYYLRNVPLPTGAVITFPVISEGKSWEALAIVVRREVIETPMGKVRCIVIKPETRYQGILKKSGDSYLWLTDDDRRWLVQLEARVRIGTVVARLKKFSPGTPP